MHGDRFNLMGEFQYIRGEQLPGVISLAKDIGVLALVAMSKNHSRSKKGQLEPGVVQH
jgi:hypothetical protein